MYKFWSTFDIISCKFITCIGIKFTSKLVYNFSNCLWRRVFFPSFEEKMLQKMAKSIILSVFVDTSCFTHDFYGSRVGVFHGCKNDVDSCDVFYSVLHD